MDKTIIEPKGLEVPKYAFSTAIKTGNMVLISEQLTADESGRIVEPVDIRA